MVTSTVEEAVVDSLKICFIILVLYYPRCYVVFCTVYSRLVQLTSTTTTTTVLM